MDLIVSTGKCDLLSDNGLSDMVSFTFDPPLFPLKKGPQCALEMGQTLVTHPF